MSACILHDQLLVRLQEQEPAGLGQQDENGDNGDQGGAGGPARACAHRSGTGIHGTFTIGWHEIPALFPPVGAAVPLDVRGASAHKLPPMCRCGKYASPPARTSFQAPETKRPGRGRDESLIELPSLRWALLGK